MLEAEIHNYEQGERRAYQEESHDAGWQKGRTIVKRKKCVRVGGDGRHGGDDADAASQAEQVTFDVCQISKTKAQTKVMLLLIPEGKEGQLCCQSVQMSE
jgi:hypothetical protein